MRRKEKKNYPKLQDSICKFNILYIRKLYKHIIHKDLLCNYSVFLFVICKYQIDSKICMKETQNAGIRCRF